MILLSMTSITLPVSARAALLCARLDVLTGPLGLADLGPSFPTSITYTT
jgi:hypothetical protein